MNAKKTTNKVSKHKYRVSVYLGKELYGLLDGVAKMLNIPLSTAVRIMIETGVQLGRSMDKESFEEIYNHGKSKV